MNQNSVIFSPIVTLIVTQTKTAKSIKYYILDKHNASIYSENVVIEQLKFGDINTAFGVVVHFEKIHFGDRVFKDSSNNIIHYHKLKIYTNDIEYQQQESNIITQVVKFEDNGNSNTNGYNSSMDIKILSHCFNTGLLLFKYTNHSGIIGTNKNNLNSYNTMISEIYSGQVVYDNNLLLISRVLTGIIVSILYNIDGNNLNITINMSYKLESGDGSSYNVNRDAIFIDNNSIICPLDKIINHGTSITQIANIFVYENGHNFIAAHRINYNFSHYLQPKIIYLSNSFVYVNQIVWILFIINWICIDTILIRNATNSARNSEYSTQNLDELHDESIFFIDSHYVGLEYSRSRSQILPEKSAWNMNESMCTALPTVEDVLTKYENYEAYFTDNWHVGYSTEEHLVLECGFSKFYGFYSSNIK